MSWIDIAAIGVVGLTIGLYVLQVLLVRGAFQRAALEYKTPPEPMRKPRVSILKPLSGLDDELAENLESFAHLVGVEYELLFGVASIDDPAVPVVRDFIARHPEVEARLIKTDPDAALNPKVAQLIGLEGAATGDVLISCDSNVRVHPAYAKNLVGELCRPGVHLVSNVLLGNGEKTFGATMENLLLATFQAPGVVGGWALTNGGGLAITVGKSMCTWRWALEKVGGYRRVRNVLAEDQALGKLYVAEGYGVWLSFDQVENRNVHGSLMQTLHRHTRWAYTRRSIFPQGYAIEIILVPLLFATGFLFLAPSWITLTLFLGAAAVQAVGSRVFTAQLSRAPLPWWSFFLEIPRTWIYGGCWIAGWVGKRVRWRGHKLTIGPDGELEPTTAEGHARIHAVQGAATRGWTDITESVVPAAPPKLLQP